MQNNLHTKITKLILPIEQYNCKRQKNNLHFQKLLCRYFVLLDFFISNFHCYYLAHTATSFSTQLIITKMFLKQAHIALKFCLRK